MDDLIKNIKSKLSPDNLVEMMKDAKVIDNNCIKEEDVRSTLEEMDTDNLINVVDLTEKLTEITEMAKMRSEEEKIQNKTIIEKAKSTFGILNKPQDNEKTAYEDQDNITAFLD